MTFSERAGIRPEFDTPPPANGDAPAFFREGVIKASVDTLGWDALRHEAIEAIRGDPPHRMIRWYHDWDESYDALQDCPWWMFYDIVEAVSWRAHNPRMSTTTVGGLVAAMMLRNLSLEPPREAREYVRRINNLFHLHKIAYSLRDNEVVRKDIDEAQRNASKALPVTEPSEVEVSEPQSQSKLTTSLIVSSGLTAASVAT